MLDLAWVKDNLTAAKKSLEDRGASEGLLTEVLVLDAKHRKLLKEVEELRTKRNTAAKARAIADGKKIKAQLDDKESQLTQLADELSAKEMELPNLALPEVPVGDATKNTVLETSGEPKKFDFEIKDHLQLGERLGIIDTQQAAKVSGARFSYLKNEGALLELALVNFAMERLVKHQFSPVIPPALIKKEITSKLGYWHKGGNENYYLVSDVDGDQDSSLYLIGTGEHALVPMHWGDIIPVAELPKRYAAYSPCFRREAGTYGKDTRGIIRVHQFDKVEMVSFVAPGDDAREFELMLGLSWKMMQELGLPVQKVALSTQDMSFPAAKTVDIETWFPSQNTYRETHSISTTTDFQSRRLNTKFIDQGKTGYVHILNGTSFAVGRTLAAILENNQRPDGSVEIPKALQPYTGFDEIAVS